MSRAGVAVLLILLSTACNGVEADWRAHVEAIDFGVDIRLDAVTFDGARAYAVGSPRSRPS